MPALEGSFFQGFRSPIQLETTRHMRYTSLIYLRPIQIDTFQNVEIDCHHYSNGKDDASRMSTLQRLETLAEENQDDLDDEDYHQYCCKQSSMFRVRVSE